MATTKTTSKASNKTATKDDVSRLWSEVATLEKANNSNTETSRALRTRISSLVDELYVLRGELDTFKKQVSQDLSTVVSGLNNLSKNNK